MVEEFEYSKERRKFGRHPQFDDTDSKIVGSFNPTNKEAEYTLRDPNKLVLDNIPQMSEHRVSPTRVLKRLTRPLDQHRARSHQQPRNAPHRRWLAP